jgi:hypothetical protein
MKINSNKLKSIFLLSLVGSNLAKEEEVSNQSELTLNSLPQIGTNFTKRQDNPDPILVFGGYPMSVGVNTKQQDGTIKIIKGYCTAGFSLINTNSSVCKDCFTNDYGGFITSGFCFPSGSTDLGTLSRDVYN